jgi:hypothetical protein
MSILKSAKASKATRLGVVLGMAAAALVAVGQAPAQAATASYKVSPATGPTASTTTVLSIAGTGFKNAAGVVQLYTTTAVNAVQFTTAACPATYGAPDATHQAATALSVPSATQLVVTTPSLALTASKPTAFNVCVYGPANLMGSTKYTVYAVPAITAALSTSSGPASGGNTVVITGTGFTKASVVKFGTVAAAKPVVSAAGDSITVTAPAQAAGAIAVSVTTEGGTNPTPGTATWDDFTYKNAIVVSPTRLPTATVATIDVQGVGFSLGRAAAVTNTTTFGVVVYSGTYVAGGAGTTGSVCTNLQVVSDTELVCDVPSIAVDGAYNVVVTSNTAQGAAFAAPAWATVLSSGATVTVAGF